MGMSVTEKLKKFKEFKDHEEKVAKHAERIMKIVDEQMYLIAQSEKKEEKKDAYQRSLGIAIMGELMDSFEKEEQTQILGFMNKVFK